MRTSTRIAGLAAAGAVLLSACGTVPAGVAASVGDTDIPTSTLEARVRSQVNSTAFASVPPDQVAAETSNLQQQVLSQLVFQELIAAAATDLGVEVTDGDVDDEWEVQVGLAGGEDALRARIDELGLTEAEAREQLRSQLLQRAIEERFTAEAEVSDAEIQSLYDERAAQYELVTYADIVVDNPEEAQAIVDLLAEGQDFNELARTRSLDPGAAGNGGEVGPRPASQTDPDIVGALRDAAPGQIVGPLATADGLFHVLRFDGFETLGLGDVRDQLRDEIASQRSSQGMQAFFGELVQRHEVAVNPRFGDWDPARFVIVPPVPVGSRSQNL